MKLSLYTLLGKDLPLDKVIELAKKTGFEAVDIRQAEDGKHIPVGVTDEEVEKIREMISHTGLEISGLTTYHRIGECEETTKSKMLSNIKRAIEIAHHLRAKFLRISGSDLNLNVGYETQREEFREQAMQISEIAKKFGIVVTVEQHCCLLTSSAGQILDLMRGLDTSYLGIVYDPGNTLREGYERPLVQIEMLRYLIKNVHVKNARFIEGKRKDEYLPAEPTKLDEGFLDWRLIIKHLKRIGYNGYLTLEDFAPFDSLEEKLIYDLNYLKTLLED